MRRKLFWAVPLSFIMFLTGVSAAEMPSRPQPKLMYIKCSVRWTLGVEADWEITRVDLHPNVLAVEVTSKKLQSVKMIPLIEAITDQGSDTVHSVVHVVLVKDAEVDRCVSLVAEAQKK